MPYNPTTIANYFIEKYSRDGDLTPMKVIKLTYISYGWYLALTENKERLIDESPVAWDFGPVFPSLYLSLKKYGKKEIKEKIPNVIKDDKISDDDKKFLDYIINNNFCQCNRHDADYPEEFIPTESIISYSSEITPN